MRISQARKALSNAQFVGVVLLLLFLLLWGREGGGGGPAPIKEPGFRFLFVEEVNARTREITELLNDPELLDFLNAKCVKVGGVPEWRKFDKDQKLTGTSQLWKDAMARALTTPGFKVPWLIVSNGKTGFEGQPPTLKTKELIEFLKPYAGKN